MQIIEQTRIFNPNDWGSSGIFSAFSHDGQLIAVRVPSILYNSSRKKKDNLFIYDIYGNEKWSGYSADGGDGNEKGIAFYPDKYSLLVPGCDDNHGNLDGLKCYKIGGIGYTLPFSQTYLSGINTSIILASDNGEAILGRKCGDNRLFCVISKKELPINLAHCTEAYFSSDVEFLALTSILGYESWVYQLSEQDKKIELSGQFVCFLPDRKILEYVNKSFVVWDISNLQEIHNIRVDLPPYIVSGASTDDGQFFALCDFLGEISLWETKSFTLLSKTKLPSNYIASRMRFSTDRQYLLTEVMDEKRIRKEIIVWLTNL